MRKLIIEEWISLDGYVEDKNGKLDFLPSTEDNKSSDEDQLQALENIDTILIGRKTYELFADFWPEATSDKEIIADKLNSIPKTIFSSTLENAPWGKFPEANIISGNIIEEIKKLKAQDGKNIILWGSIMLAQALIENKLLDELRLHICPVISGGGKRLFPRLDGYQNLQLTGFKQYNTGIAYLQYQLK